MKDVTAIAIGPRDGFARAARRDQVAAVFECESAAGLQAAARAAATELVWIVDAGAVPDERTLPALLDAGAEPAASLPVDAAGEPVEAAVGRFAEDDAGALIAAAARRRVPLRRARLVSLLARREDVAAEAAPDPVRFGHLAGDEWTGRLFARRPGVLVPASRIVVAPERGGDPLAVIRTARAAGWGMGETLRELGRVLRG